LFEPADGDSGIVGVDVCLVNQETGAVVAHQMTGTEGMYAFAVRVKRGTYQLVESQPGGFLDGKESAGTLGGDFDNSLDSNRIWNIAIPPVGTVGPVGSLRGEGYNFGELRPGRLQDLVWEDFNDDAEVNFGEKAIADVLVRLTGRDDRGQLVDRVSATDSPVRPEAAFYSRQLQEFILSYDAVRLANNPDAALLAFCQSTYEAAANLERWDRAALERKDVP